MSWNKKKKTKIVRITEKVCRNCDHEETYHKGGGFLSRVKCLVTGCKCPGWVFGRNKTTESEVIVDG